MVKHGCEKKRDGIGQLGEEMLGKGNALGCVERQRKSYVWHSIERERICRE